MAKDSLALPAQDGKNPMRDALDAMGLNVESVESVQAIPRNAYVVYLLAFDGRCIVCGHGKFNRARVIFDDSEHATEGHIKSLLIRLYHRFGGKGEFSRYIIKCASKEEALKMEKRLHREIGGNSCRIPEKLQAQVTRDMPELPRMILEMALQSAFSGVRDLKRWRSSGILNDELWGILTQRLGKL